MTDSEDARWERCWSRDCDKVRHRPVRFGGSAGSPLVCPGSPDGKHQWQPLSFVFETQLLDRQGRVLARQPDIEEGRVYAVCMPCRSHTYLVTAWVGYYLGYPFMEQEEDRAAAEAADRAAEEDTDAES
ncbi:MAG TPA: hypothetical protein VFH77_17440 [Streptomyces sp.]|nr:hypothetical protein [Streptomyces sp.]